MTRIDHVRDEGKMIICKQEQEALEEASAAGTLMLDFQFSEP